MTISGVGNTSSVTQIATDNMGGVSLNMRFAQLQLQASENAKEKAEGLMQQVEKQNLQQAELSKALAVMQANIEPSDSNKDNSGKYVDATKLQFSYQTTNAEGERVTIDTNIHNWMNTNPELKALYDTTGGDKAHSKAQMNSMITALQSHAESIGTDTQTLMIQLQDMMGQYNNFLQGAKSAVDANKQTLNALVR